MGIHETEHGYTHVIISQKFIEGNIPVLFLFGRCLMCPGNWSLEFNIRVFVWAQDVFLAFVLPAANEVRYLWTKKLFLSFCNFR